MGNNLLCFVQIKVKLLTDIQEIVKNSILHYLGLFQNT